MQTYQHVSDSVLMSFVVRGVGCLSQVGADCCASRYEVVCPQGSGCVGAYRVRVFKSNHSCPSSQGYLLLIKPHALFVALLHLVQGHVS